MTPRLEKCFTMRGYMDRQNNHSLKAIKAGPTRIMVPITHGWVEGMGLRAEITPGGADWILLDTSTQTAHLDVRTQAGTADGESLYIHYTGILKMDPKAEKVLSWAADAQTTEYGDHEWFAGPIIETSSDKFKWAESTLFVGEGRFVVEEDGGTAVGRQGGGGKAAAVEYEIYRVVN